MNEEEDPIIDDFGLMLNDILFNSVQTEDGAICVHWLGKNEWLIICTEGEPDLYKIKLTRANV